MNGRRGADQLWDARGGREVTPRNFSPPDGVYGSWRCFQTGRQGYGARVRRAGLVEDHEAAPAVHDDADAALVRRCRRGDTGAFAELVSLHQDVVLRVAARIVGEDESADVAQDTFLRAFHRLDRFRSEASFRAWLLQIARNSALDALGARGRRPLASDDVEARSDLDGTAMTARTPVQELDERERRDRLRLKLRLLPDQHRAVLVLRELEGLSYEEIAVATESPVGSVKGRLHRARGELADILRRNTYDWQLPRER